MPTFERAQIISPALDEPVDVAAPTRIVAWGFLLAALTISAYLPAFRADFIWQDDQGVTHNPLLRSSAGLARIWTEPRATPRFQPLTYSWFWIQHQLWGASPVGYHAAGIILHAANAMLLWALLRRLAVPGAWFAALLFAIHPVQVEAVAWVSQGSSILSATFYLGALLVYRAWLQSTSEVEPDEMWAPPPLLHIALPESPVLRYILSLVLAAFAMLSDPGAATWPLSAAIIVWWERGAITRRDFKALSPFIMLAVAVACCAMLWPTGETSAGWIHQRLIAGRAAMSTAGVNFWLNIVKLVIPVPAVIHFELRGASTAGLWKWCSLALLVAVTAIVWACRNRLGRAATWALLLFCACGVLSGVLQHRTSDSALILVSGLSYLPVGLLFAILVAGASQFAAPNRLSPLLWRRVSIAGCTAISLGFATLTFLSATRYADAATFWQQISSDAAGKAFAQRQLGDLAMRAGSGSAAAEYYEAALRFNQLDVETAVGLAHALDQQGQHDRATETISQALLQSPQDATLLSTLAHFEALDGHFDRAATHYHAALQSRPDDARIHNDFGLFLAARGSLDQAAAQYRDAIAAHPQFLPPRVNLATVLFRQRHFDEAADELRTVVQMDPNNFEAYVNSGAMLAELKQFAGAERMFRSALAIKNDSPEVWNNLGATLVAQNRMSEAKWCFAQSQQLRGESQAKGSSSTQPGASRNDPQK